MTNSKKTKRALLSSVISLILCLSMLVGTTFAWFTDSVTSGVNEIVAGNLDIEVTVDGESIENMDTLFNYVTLWEPGAVAWENLTVSNVGTLDLKYQVAVNFENENTVNGYGLSTALKVAMVDEIPANATREEVLALAGEGKELASFVQYGDLLDGESDVYGVIIWWEPTENDNNWNVNNGKTTSDGEDLHIDLGIKVAATQRESENDSFDNTYDEDAKYDVTPIASVKQLAVAPTVALYNEELVATGESAALDVAYEFVTTQTAAQAEEMESALWNVDFVVSFDKSVAANSIVLGGYYQTWCAANNNDQWLAFANKDAIAAGEEYRLLKDTAGIMVNYTELCNLVKNFQCGAADLTGKNAGTTMTVELRMYETYTDTINGILSSNWENGEYVTVGTYTYTFRNDETVPAVTPEEVVVENEEMVIWDLATNGTSEETMTLDAAYSFTAPDTAETVANSAYKDWKADWFVSIDQVVEEGLYLAGNYGTWGWIGFEVPAGEQYTEYGLMTNNFGAWTYEQIVTDVGTFTCGVADTEGNNEGATITVELRLTNPYNDADYYVISRTEMPL